MSLLLSFSFPSNSQPSPPISLSLFSPTQCPHTLTLVANNPPHSLGPPGGWGAAVFALSTADDPRSWPNATEPSWRRTVYLFVRVPPSLQEEQLSPSRSTFIFFPSRRITLAEPRRRVVPFNSPIAEFEREKRQWSQVLRLFGIVVRDGRG